LISQSCSGKAMQLLPGENSNRFEYHTQNDSELPQVPNATYPVDRRNQILLTSLSPGKTTSGLLLATDGP
jgi:hypothetical protein